MNVYEFIFNYVMIEKVVLVVLQFVLNYAMIEKVMFAIVLQIPWLLCDRTGMQYKTEKSDA